MDRAASRKSLELAWSEVSATHTLFGYLLWGYGDPTAVPSLSAIGLCCRYGKAAAAAAAATYCADVVCDRVCAWLLRVCVPWNDGWDLEKVVEDDHAVPHDELLKDYVFLDIWGGEGLEGRGSGRYR